MLESLKEYAAEQLAAYGEVEKMRDRHVRYALAKAAPVRDPVDATPRVDGRATPAP